VQSFCDQRVCLYVSPSKIGGTDFTKILSALQCPQMSTPVCRSVHAGFLSRLASSRPRPRFCNGRASVRPYHRLTTATAGGCFCCWAPCGHDISIESCRFCTATNKAYRWCIHIQCRRAVSLIFKWQLQWTVKIVSLPVSQPAALVLAYLPAYAERRVKCAQAGEGL